MATLHFWEWGKILFEVNYSAGLMQGTAWSKAHICKDYAGAFAVSV